ncbi:D-aminoacyl-tRNA deacylase [Tuwongella immobilis]|uniref:D-aminoacyl-tRNA deacylase n=1 Tax=Tuwongella immobilis TaxID=692036 RepID=A0A6C2YRT1_9BACT|nr:D-aminoacyl-tRNA deacylase [Tuwongella immobilis]VIP03833.1 d-tyrosyl-trna deacylase : D-aminoacyl-tRNA deacylase OS=Desulfitobacterium dehalogenans (strain ATCC 51507 / DSM 9161 / JW/IU-DC1) GN=dtd PE=3 SV=1: Tyr_Deacylase [Tuwongella immobilis]VTS05033.1 d-tyrosyl-trna deacylase : D-aminoacyl-tRNA deacylase OS=Desulfitobacterium dehalogenans (strain ATCC 51507 / DSM 9161 / JW/IU-DC1) GN=dtd PE=3 SV=1: Tyr_Deacylase [Tuwongella immobilis]
MRAVIQRVRSAKVEVAGEIIGEIGMGLLVLIGIHEADRPEMLTWMSDKLLGIRIFEDSDGKMNRSIQEVGGSLLVVSQFTLYGDCQKGRRPSFIAAARPEFASPMVDQLVQLLRNSGIRVETGRFGADMQVSLVNDGPVTLVLDAPVAKTNLN